MIFHTNSEKGTPGCVFSPSRGSKDLPSPRCGTALDQLQRSSVTGPETSYRAHGSIERMRCAAPSSKSKGFFFIQFSTPSLRAAPHFRFLCERARMLPTFDHLGLLNFTRADLGNRNWYQSQMRPSTRI